MARSAAPRSHIVVSHGPRTALPSWHPTALPTGGPLPRALSLPRPMGPAQPAMAAPGYSATRAHPGHSLPSMATGSKAVTATRPSSPQIVTTDGASGPPAPPETPTPPSAIGDPLPELPPVAPLSPQLPTQFATSSVAQPGLALSPGSSSASPSEIGAERTRRRGQDVGRLYGLLGPGDPHDQGRVEGCLHTQRAGLPQRAPVSRGEPSVQECISARLAPDGRMLAIDRRLASRSRRRASRPRRSSHASGRKAARKARATCSAGRSRTPRSWRRWPRRRCSAVRLEASLSSGAR